MSRFASPYGEHKLDKLAEGFKPVNAEVSTQWVVNDFTKWAESWRKLVPHDPVPGDLLECHNPATVSKYLCMFLLRQGKKMGININQQQSMHCLVELTVCHKKRNHLSLFLTSKSQ